MKQRHGIALAGLALTCAGTFGLQAQSKGSWALKDAKIVRVSGPVIEHGTVVVRDGLIEAVGDASTAVPADAWVVDCKGMTVYPGLIDGLSNWGLTNTPAGTAAAAAGGRGGGGRAAVVATPTPAPTAPTTPVATTPSRGPEDRPSNVAYIKAADQIFPNDRALETQRNGGFTSAVTFPNGNIFSGQGSVINLFGERAGDLVIEPNVGQFLTLGSGGRGGGGRGYPGSLMGVIAYIRQIYIDANYYRAAKEDYAKSPSGKKRPEYDRALEGLIEAPQVLLPATYVRELERMIRLSADLKSKPLLYGGHEAYKAAAMLKQQNATVLVNLKWPEKPRDSDPDLEDSLRTLELREKAASSPAALAKAGVKFAFYASGIDTARDIPKAVKKAIDAGLSPEDALRALTLSPAEIYGVADRMGSIEKGKIANLVITNGDLFQDRTQVKYVFIDGVKMEPTPETPAAAPAQETQQ